MLSRIAALALLVVIVVAAPSAAAGRPGGPLDVDAGAKRTGWIALNATGTPGATVAVAETTAGGEEPLTTLTLDRGGRARRAKAVPWRCDRTERHLVARSNGEKATADVRTPRCRDRLAVAIEPFAPRARRPIRLRLRDHWGLGGVAVRVCVRPRGGRRRCTTARIRPRHRVVKASIRAPRGGLATITARAPWGQRVRRAVDVRGRGRKLTILATGDSMIQVVDSFLRSRLASRQVAVRSDAHVSTGISKPFMLDWVKLARRQAASRHPHVTVIFIGANDGFAIGGVQCCGRRWIRGYARRVRRMAAAYQRGGAARVYWLTLPRPRPARFRRVFRAVDAALRLAEPRIRRSGRLLDMGRVFTPRGRFRASVRQPDGVHLNRRGAAIAARVVARALRRDGVLP